MKLSVRGGVRRLLRVLGTAVGCACLGAACSSSPPSLRLQIEVSLTQRANHDAPVPVSFVAVKDPKFFEKVLGLSAKQWFEQREQLRRDDPSGQLFTEWEWEHVPGYAPPPVVIEVDGNAIGAVIFANYHSPGDHRIRVGPQRRFRIELGDDDLVVRPLDLPDETP
jgi:type VI secretion system protein